jgi:DUF1365 family protein
LFGHDQGNLYSLRETDHEPAGPQPLKERINAFLRQNGIEPGPFGRVMLLTLPRILGYVFNPISIYYCFDSEGAPICSVAEVGNTFREMKLFLLGRETLGAGQTFSQVVPKHFYVSPFSGLELSFDFRLRVPDRELNVKINDRDGDKTILISTLTGRRAALTNTKLTWFTIKYPLLTLKVMFLIHWHAFRLWLKRIPFYRKAENVGLQRDVLRPHATLPQTIK